MNLAAKHRFGLSFVSSSYGRGSSAGLAWAGFGCRTLSWRPGHTWFPRHDQTWLKQNWHIGKWLQRQYSLLLKIVQQRFGCRMLPLHLVKSFTTLEHTWALFLKAKAAEASSARSQADVESAPAITILRLQWNSKTCGDRKPNWRPKNIQKQQAQYSAMPQLVTLRRRLCSTRCQRKALCTGLGQAKPSATNPHRDLRILTAGQKVP